jgi:tetratricopeptide (TPR) repeat protein
VCVPALGLAQDYEDRSVDASRLWYLLPIGLAFYFGYMFGKARGKSGLAILACVLLSACAGRQAAQWNEKGLAAESARDWKGAADAYSQAVRLEPSVAKYHCNLGIVLGRLGYYENATLEFREALRLDPGYRDAGYGLEIIARRLDTARATAIADELH